MPDSYNTYINKGWTRHLRTDAMAAIDKSNEVYDNILASLFEKDMLVLYSEMKALQTMFTIAGLTNSYFEIH